MRVGHDLIVFFYPIVWVTRAPWPEIGEIETLYQCWSLEPAVWDEGL